MKLRLELGKLCLHYDTNYGIDRRRGWSAAWDGSFVAQFRALPVIGWKVLRRALSR